MNIARLHLVTTSKWPWRVAVTMSASGIGLLAVSAYLWPGRHLWLVGYFVMLAGMLLARWDSRRDRSKDGLYAEVSGKPERVMLAPLFVHDKDGNILKLKNVSLVMRNKEGQVLESHNFSPAACPSCHRSPCSDDCALRFGPEFAQREGEKGV